MASAGDAVAVALAGSRSHRALRWAAEILIPDAPRVLLLHVIPVLRAIPDPSGRLIPIDQVSSEAALMYEQDRKLQARQYVLPFKKMCRTTKEVEILVLDGESTADVLLKYAAESGVENLVLGGSSWTWFRSFLGHETPVREVAKNLNWYESSAPRSPIVVTKWDKCS